MIATLAAGETTQVETPAGEGIVMTSTPAGLEVSVIDGVPHAYSTAPSQLTLP